MQKCRRRQNLDVGSPKPCKGGQVWFGEGLSWAYSGPKIGLVLGQKFRPLARQMGNTKIKTLLTLSKIREINMKIIKIKNKIC